MLSAQIITLFNSYLYAVKAVAHFINITFRLLYLHFKETDYIINATHASVFSPSFLVHTLSAVSVSCTDYSCSDGCSPSNYPYPTNTISQVAGAVYALLSPLKYTLMVSAIIFQLQTALSIEPVHQGSQGRLFAYRCIECNPAGAGLGVQRSVYLFHLHHQKNNFRRIHLLNL